jgi:hypothetical protein
MRLCTVDVCLTNRFEKKKKKKKIMETTYTCFRKQFMMIYLVIFCFSSIVERDIIYIYIWLFTYIVIHVIIYHILIHI